MMDQRCGWNKVGVLVPTATTSSIWGTRGRTSSKKTLSQRGAGVDQSREDID